MTLLSATDLDNPVVNIGLYAIFVFILWITQSLWRRND